MLVPPSCFYQDLGGIKKGCLLEDRTGYVTRISPFKPHKFTVNTRKNYTHLLKVTKMNGCENGQYSFYYNYTLRNFPRKRRIRADSHYASRFRSVTERHCSVKFSHV
jgi:hypothetical protein